MNYQSIKSRPLSKVELNRLRVAIGTRLRLDEPVPPPSQTAGLRSTLTKSLSKLSRRLGRPVLKRAPAGLQQHLRARQTKKSGPALEARLRRFFADPVTNHNDMLLAWSICFAPPSLLRHLMSHPAAINSEKLNLRALASSGPEDLLPRDHIQPDIQIVRTSLRPKKALICFTGKAMQLNMPVRVFHLLASPHFDCIVYLRDHCRQLFLDGIETVADDLGGLNAFVRKQVPDDCALSVLSTSGGSIAATFFAERYGAQRALLSGPLAEFRNTRPLARNCQMETDNVRLIFAKRNPMDQRFAEQWAATAYAPAMRMLDTNRHDTLTYLFEQNGDLENMLSWLAGANTDPLAVAGSPPIPAAGPL